MRPRSAIILDGYVDEPTALGVPPYISPYPRYVAGVLEAAGVPWRYVTIDQWRTAPEAADMVRALCPSDLLVIVSGLTVPGHYKGGTPLSWSELRAVVSQCRAPAVVGGPIRHGYTLTGGTRAMPLDHLCLRRGDADRGPPAARTAEHGGGDRRQDPGAESACSGLGSLAVARADLDALLADRLAGRGDAPRFHTFAEVSEWARLGARLAALHPDFPHVIAEIETARGCERTAHCSFCTEGLYETAEYRPAEDIVAEVAALHAAGVRHFRLGKQPNFFAWPGRRGRDGAIVPAPDAIAQLYRDLRSVAPDLATLHLDNVNPGFLAAHPDECQEIAAIVAAHNTPGDVAALGVESMDPAVAQANNLKASAADARRAVELLNRAGAGRTGRSLPALLPGINLLYGLPGETAATYDLNFRFLADLLDAELMIRRVNVRQVMIFPETPLYRATQGRSPKIDKARFRRFKQRVFEEIERPMLRRVAPVGTILRGVVTEFHDGDVTFGRQLASYPLLVGFPLRLPLRQVLDVIVVDHGFRSVTGLPWPIRINELPENALAALPGIGRPRARRLTAARPFAATGDVAAALDEPSVIAQFLKDLSL